MQSFLSHSFRLTSLAVEATMGVAIRALAQGEGTDSRLTMAYAQDDGFFETDRDSTQRGH